MTSKANVLVVALFTSVLVGGVLLGAAGVATSALSAVTIPGPESHSKNGYNYNVQTPWREYLASWRGDGRGDNVAFNAWLSAEAGARTKPDWYYYTIELSGRRQNGAPGTADYESSCPNEANQARLDGVAIGIDRIDLRACNFKLVGDQTGILKVTLYTRHCIVFTGNDPNCGTVFAAAADYALVASGATMLEFSETKTVYEEGDQVKVRLRTGSCGVAAQAPGFTGCYTLVVHDSKGTTRHSQMVKAHAGETSLGATSWEYVTYTIPKGAFVPRDPFDNEWTIELLNNVVSAKSLRLFTIDSLDKAPPPPTVKVSPNVVVAGSQITVDIEAKNNPNGTVDLRRARVYAWYGRPSEQPGLGSTNWIATGKNVSLTLLSDAGGYRTYTARTILPIDREGEVIIEVRSVDTDARVSEPARARFLTIEGQTTPEDIPTSQTPRVIIVAAILLIAAAVVAVLVFVREPLHKWGSVAGLCLAGIVVVAWVLWTANGGA